MIENALPPKAEAKNLWQQLLGPKFTEDLIAEAHREASQMRRANDDPTVFPNIR